MTDKFSKALDEAVENAVKETVIDGRIYTENLMPIVEAMVDKFARLIALIDPFRQNPEFIQSVHEGLDEAIEEYRKDIPTGIIATESKN